MVRLRLNFPRALLLAAALLIWSGGAAPRADTVTLKNGKKFYNVKTVSRGSAQYIVFSDGRIKRVEAQDIALISILPVSWKRGPSAGQMEKLVRAAIREEIRRSQEEFLKKQEERARKDEARRGREAARLARLEQLEKDRQNRTNRARQRLGNLWRSALLPGWGQYRREDRLRGALYFSGSLFLLAGYWKFRGEHATAQRDLNQDLTPLSLSWALGPDILPLNYVLLENSRRDLLQREKRTNRTFLVLSLLYIWNLLDAAIFDRAPSGSRGPRYQTQGTATGGQNIGFVLGFSPVGSGREAPRYSEPQPGGPQPARGISSQKTGFYLRMEVTY